ncbi:MAG TPA: ATP-binding protein [Ferruginibacter sp.]|nr:ATP-binding protein [Ferruginibacter sp.]
MVLQPILALIILQYYRKSFNKNTIPGNWKILLTAGNVISIVMLSLFILVKDSRLVVTWLGHLFLLAVIIKGYLSTELKNARSILNAFLPVAIIYFVSYITSFLFKPFYNDWQNYFDVAEIFAFIWMIPMLIISNKQRKALEKEKLKTEEAEKVNQITQKLKAGLEIQVSERTAELTAQKEELEQTLIELKATQAQLIQSEKMASLGELTAGIAHEIQNPLNFVNNFSEVNTELIAEMKAELAKGNFEEVKSIATNIDDNEKKIIYHGKRADAIVKGMLQHSRSSSSIKEPTDINALCDEYLRLAYHGLRAKDKNFNATIKTDFDNSIGSINIIPQDLGRVILNLLTNAFYAVSEKQKQKIAGYEPTVEVSTHRNLLTGKDTGGEVEIKVTDNGNGIPQRIIDKIYQPFFTTKPTGQGTGLGLSLSYDIITKGHNGNLKVESKEGEGSQFIIILNL